MASEADHIALANKNHDVLVYLLEDVERFPEWVTVAAFYKAVQIVDAMFRKATGRCCFGHDDRLNKLKIGHKALHKHFRVLWSASSIARYLYDTVGHTPYSCFTDYMTPEQVRRTIVGKRLRGVECEALRFLSEDARSQLQRVPEQ